jgi:hypothetical protein
MCCARLTYTVTYDRDEGKHLFLFSHYCSLFSKTRVQRQSDIGDLEINCCLHLFCYFTGWNFTPVIYYSFENLSLTFFPRCRNNVPVRDPGNRLIPRIKSGNPERTTNLHRPHRLAGNSLLDQCCTARMGKYWRLLART